MGAHISPNSIHRACLVAGIVGYSRQRVVVAIKDVEKPRVILRVELVSIVQAMVHTFDIAYH